MTSNSILMDMKFYPLTPKRWNDLVQLFGPHGACGGCWCMFWRLPGSLWEKQRQNHGRKNKQTLKKIANSGEVPGILAYANGQPIAWCSIGPREIFCRLERSRTLKRIDESPVWSVVCFFIDRRWRRKGVTVELLKVAVEYAKKKGAKIVEDYPIEPKKPNYPDIAAWTGFSQAFRKAGFIEVARRTKTRPIMRYFI